MKRSMNGQRVLVPILVVASLGVLVATGGKRKPSVGEPERSVEVSEYRRPQVVPDDRISDDRLESKITSFDPSMVDPRPLGDWLVNQSEAVIRLDTPVLFPDADAALLELHPTFRAAIRSAKAVAPSVRLLPSVSMIDGKAKQFDDGLYAALERSYYAGLDGTLLSHVTLVRRLLQRVGPDSPAAAYLSAGLTLAGEEHPVADMAARAAWLKRFEDNISRSRPAGFYTWNKGLADCFRFLRYFQSRQPQGAASVSRALADGLLLDEAILADYKKAIAFYARLTDPSTDLTYVDIAEGQATPDDPRRISFFPNSSSRENVLFAKLFPEGLPPDADLMRTMIVKIRSGEVSLQPRPGGGWYDYQVYALETLILPEKGEEKDKLLLTRAYKERMIDAFKAQMTRRRETHARQLDVETKSESVGAISEPIAPRLRLEPCPTYYLRTARAYGFLASFLETTIRLPALKSLHGLKQDGERPLPLHDELLTIRDLFYGFYLVSAEDIGMKPHFLAGEPVDVASCKRAATSWLEGAPDDPDLAADVRVAVPVYFDRPRTKTRLWTTLGVRLVKLDARYARPPSLKPRDGGGDWVRSGESRLGTSDYLIAVDEFAEVEIGCICVPTREELRSICDRCKTKGAIIGALRVSR